MNQSEIKQKIKFFEAFAVEVDSLATQTLVYVPGNSTFSYEDTDVYGETDYIRLIELEERETVLEIKHTDEEAFVDEMSQTFAALGYDVAAFIQAVQKKYKNDNQI